MDVAVFLIIYLYCRYTLPSKKSIPLPTKQSRRYWWKCQRE